MVRWTVLGTEFRGGREPRCCGTKEVGEWMVKLVMVNMHVLYIVQSSGGEGGVCVHSREDECLCAFFASSVRAGNSVTAVPTKVVCIVHGLLARSCKPRGKVDEKVRTYYLPV